MLNITLAASTNGASPANRAPLNWRNRARKGRDVPSQPSCQALRRDGIANAGISGALARGKQQSVQNVTQDARPQPGFSDLALQGRWRRTQSPGRQIFSTAFRVRLSRSHAPKRGAPTVQPSQDQCQTKPVLARRCENSYGSFQLSQVGDANRLGTSGTTRRWKAFFPR
jgi:hypothetical protein